jgi:hypothetical protein
MNSANADIRAGIGTWFDFREGGELGAGLELWTFAE